MLINEDKLTIIILCSFVALTTDSGVKPFTVAEWYSFVDDLKKIDKEPNIILQDNWAEILADNYFSESNINRIAQLINRKDLLIQEISKLADDGIHIVTVSESEYPVLLKRKLKRKAPTLLYYVGNIDLSRKIGIAVVGSRNVDEGGIEFTKRLVEKASQEKLVIYSGGARGVDSISEMTALQNGSAVVSYVADSLYKKMKKRDISVAIQEGRILLLSDVKPDVGFSAHRAMSRNKYIYTSAYGAFVVSSDYNKGGTWNGAIENMNNNWTKTFVWNHKEYLGNMKLIEQGANSYEISNESIYNIVQQKKVEYSQYDIYSLQKSLTNQGEVKQERMRDTDDIFLYIKQILVEKFRRPLSLNEACNKFNITEAQMEIWLKRLCEDDELQNNGEIYVVKESKK